MNRTRSFTCECCRIQTPLVFKPGCPGCRIRQAQVLANKQRAAASKPGQRRPT